MNWNKELPLIQSLCLIVASMFIITGGSYAALQHTRHSTPKIHYEPLISSIIQTGPQSRALSTDYLAELLNLSSDKPCFVKDFNLKDAQVALLHSPLISKASINLLKPGTLYIDYTVRQPIAWLEDYENVVIDKEGYLFPFAPFFSPKNLPSFYLGLAPFGTLETEKLSAKWQEPLKGKLLELCLSILNCVNESDQFFVKRIDVSNALSASYGKREIVLITEDTFIQHIQGKDIQFHQPRLLRLNTKNFAQELSNYLNLRGQLLEEEQKILSLTLPTASIIHLPEKVLDFRIDHLAFIQD